MICVRGLVAVLVSGASLVVACGSSDAGDLPSGCRKIEARHYDAENNCNETVKLTGVCFTASRGNRESGEDVCLRAPSGDYYVANKDFNECLAGPGWVTDDAGEGHGWSVWGATSGGLCANDYSTELPDGGLHQQTCGKGAESGSADPVPDCE